MSVEAAPGLEGRSTPYRVYALGAMTAIYTLNLVDRGLIMLLLHPIKQDLSLSDTQLGLLTGILFGLFYAVLGVPIARWADRGDRVTVASLAIGLWGLTVMATMLVANYWQLVVARIAAAVGEAGCKPPTYSLVGDYFTEPTARTRAMAVYMTAGPLALLISFVAGGWLAETYGWRVAFFILGVPGLLLAILFRLTVVEPRARVAIDARSGAENVRDEPRFVDVFRLMWRQRASRHIAIALILLYTMGYGLSPWYAAFMIRTHHMGTSELGVAMGLIFSIAGVIGVLAGGAAATRWFGTDPRGQLRLSTLSVAAVLPCFILFLTLPGGRQALAALFPLMLLFNAFLGPTYALMQRLVPAGMRATMMALVMLLANLIGFGLGPQAVGVLSDALAPRFGVDSLRYAMLMLSFVALWSAWHFWRAGRTVALDLDAVGREAPKLDSLPSHAPAQAGGAA